MQGVIKLLSTGGKKIISELQTIEKLFTSIFKKQQAINKTALKFNKVRAATRRVKGSGLNLNTSTPLEGLDDKAREQKLGKLSGTTRRYVVALNKANKELNGYVRSLATADGAQSKFTGSSRKITTQVSALQDRLNSLSRTNKEYTSTLQATLRGEQALYKVQRNRAVDELAQFPEQRLKKDGTPDKRFTRTGVEDLVGTTIGEFEQGKIANSINGLNNYIDRLEALRAKVQLGSKSFNDLQQQIALVNLKLKEADPLPFSSKIEAAAKGPATKLDSMDAFRQKERFASDLNRTEDKRLQLLSRINDSSLAEVTKQKLKNQLSQTDVQLQQKELELARATNKEVDKELSSLNKKQQRQKFRAGRKDRITQSALIGGGFPFLFGGGPLQALAGGLGGGIGEAVSPGGGFAGSIAATAAISQIAQGVEALGNLGKAMNKATMDTTALIAAMGMAGTVDGERIQLIEQLEGKQAAFNAAMEEMKGVVGDEGAAALQRFGDSTKKLQDAWAKFMTRLMAGVAIILEKLGIIDGIDNQTKTFNRGDIRNKINESGNDTEIVRLRAEIERIQGLSGGGRAGSKNRTDTINSLQKEIEQRALILLQQDQTIKIGINRQKTLELVTKDMTDQETLLKESLSLGNKEAQIREKIRAINKDLVDMKKTELTPEEAKQIRLDFIRIDNLTKMKELYDQIKDTIATGLTNAIEGLIAGTKTLGESLASIAKSIASMFLNSAISSLVGNISFGKPSIGTQVGNMIGKNAEGTYMANGIRPFAYGGIATKPTLGLVGEAGEDEYIIPASKMASSMQRYSAGARGEAVIPGTGSSYTGGGGGSSTTVNYSGPILNFNSEEFVPKSAIGEIIATATARGARAGETRTLSSLQNSRSRRSTLGL